MTTATFTGQSGHAYSFYSVATDELGLVQPTPATAQAATTVTVANQTSLSDVSGSGTYGGSATLTATLTADGSPLTGESVAFTLSVDGRLISEGSAITDSSGVAALGHISLAGVGAGTDSGAVEVSFTGDTTDASAAAGGDLTVTPAALTISANNQTKVYGAALPSLTASFTGFVNGDTLASLTTKPTLTTTATAGSPVSGNPYAITVSGAVDGNYTIRYVVGVLTVTPAPLTITADNASVVAGQPVPPIHVNYSGFVLGQGPAALNGILSITTSATATSPAGSYPIAPGGLSSSNYAITYVDGTLTVTPASVSAPPVTVTSLRWETLKLSRKKSVKELVLSLSGALNAADANNLATYGLDSAKGKKKTTVYTKPVALSSALYNPANNSVSLLLRAKPPAQTMQLTINAANLLDAEGREIDGNDDGQPGGNFVATLNSSRVISMARTMAETRSRRMTAAIDSLLADESFGRIVRQ